MALISGLCAARRALGQPYVVDQVGHDDQDTTNRIYRHLIRRRQEHGAAFDRVLAGARGLRNPGRDPGVCGLNVGWRRE